MNKIVGVIAVAALMTACKSNTTNPDETKVLGASSAEEMAKFQQWKEQQRLDSIKKAEEKHKTVVYKNTVVREQAPAAAAAPSAAAEPAKKKGMSKAAKGAIIGAGAGAVTGAIIAKKNRGLGAVVGGAAGAGVGYGVGRHMDNKDRNRQ